MPGVLIAALVIFLLLRSQERTIHHQRSIMATQAENIAILNQIAAKDAETIAKLASGGVNPPNDSALDAVVTQFQANSNALAALVPPPAES